MNLKDLSFPVYGDTAWRGKCPTESVEMISFFNQLRKEWPDSYGLLGVHVRNEGMLVRGQFQAMVRQKAEGMVTGAVDIIIPGSPTFVCEMKRRDHTQSKWQDGQIEYLEAAQKAGCFACVALGAAAAWDAFCAWRVATQTP